MMKTKSLLISTLFAAAVGLSSAVPANAAGDSSTILVNFNSALGAGNTDWGTWNETTTGGSTASTATLVFSDGSSGAGTLAWTAFGTWRGGSATAGSEFLKGYLDDCVNDSEHIPQITYTPDSVVLVCDITIYTGTDQADSQYTAKTIDGIAYTYDEEGNLIQGTDPWGQESSDKTATVGVNALELTNYYLTGNNIVISGILSTGNGARGGIAAIKIVDRTDEVAIRATVTGTDSTWTTTSLAGTDYSTDKIALLTISEDATITTSLKDSDEELVPVAGLATAGTGTLTISGDIEFAKNSLVRAIDGTSIAFTDGELIINKGSMVLGEISIAGVTKLVTYAGEFTAPSASTEIEVYDSAVIDYGSDSSTVTITNLSGNGKIKFESTASGHGGAVNLSKCANFTGTLAFSGKFNTTMSDNLGKVSLIEFSQNSSGAGSIWGNGTIKQAVSFTSNYQLGDSSATTFIISGNASNLAGTTLTIGGTNPNVTFTGANNNFAGTVTVAAGTATFSSTGTSSFASLTQSAGTLNITSGTNTITTLSRSAGALTISGGTNTITTFSQTTGTSLVISGGTNTITTMQVNAGPVSFTGGETTIGSFRGAYSTSANPTYTIGSGAMVNVTNDFILRYEYGGTSTMNVAGNLTVGGNLDLARDGYGYININDGGSVSAGTIRLGQAWSGTKGAKVTVNVGGELIVGSGGVVLGYANNNSSVIALAGGTLGTSADAMTISSDISVTLGTETTSTINTAKNLETDGTGSTITIAGTISGDGALTKTGAGTLVIGGSSAQSISGVTLDEGTLQISTGTTITDFTYNGGALAVDTGATLTLAGTLTFNSLLGASSLSNSGTLTIASDAKYVVDSSLQTSLSGFTITYTFLDSDVFGNWDSISADNLSVAGITGTVTKGNAGVITLDFGVAADAVYTTNLNGTGTTVPTFNLTSGDTTAYAATLSGTNIDLTAFSGKTLGIVGNSNTAIAASTASGGAGGRATFVAYDNSAEHVNIVVSKGFELNLTGIQGNTNVTLYFNDASFYGDTVSNSIGTFAFDFVVGDGGVRLNGGGGNNYVYSGAISGTGTIYYCTGNSATEGQSNTFLGDTSDFMGTWTRSIDNARKMIFGDGTQTYDVGGNIGTLAKFEGTVQFNYENDFSVLGNLYVTNLQVVSGNATFESEVAPVSISVSEGATAEFSSILLSSPLGLSDSTSIVNTKTLNETTGVVTSKNDVTVSLFANTESIARTNWAELTADSFGYAGGTMTYDSIEISDTGTLSFTNLVVNIPVTADITNSTYVYTATLPSFARVYVSSEINAYFLGWDTSALTGTAYTNNIHIAEGGSITINNGGSANIQIFTGEFTGSGNFIFGTSVNPPKCETYVFLGDMSGFEGDITRSTVSNTTSFTATLTGQTGIIQFGTSDSTAVSRVTLPIAGGSVSGTGTIDTAGLLRYDYASGNDLTVGNAAIKAKLLDFTGGANYTVTADLTGKSSSTLRVDDYTSVKLTGTVSSFDEILLHDSASLELAGTNQTVVVTTISTKTNGAALVSTGASLTIGEGASLSATASGGTFANFTLKSAGTLTLQNAISSGTVEITAGTTTLSGAVSGLTAITVAENATLSAENSSNGTSTGTTIKSAGTTTLAGTFNGADITVSAGTTTLSGTVGASTATVDSEIVTTATTATVSGGTLTISNTAATLGATTVSGGELNFAGTTIASAEVTGTLNLTGTAVEVAGDLTVNSSATLSVAAGTNLTLSGTTLTINKMIANEGTVTIADAGAVTIKFAEDIGDTSGGNFTTYDIANGTVEITTGTLDATKIYIGSECLADMRHQELVSGSATVTIITGSIIWNGAEDATWSKSPDDENWTITGSDSTRFYDRDSVKFSAIGTNIVTLGAAVVTKNFAVEGDTSISIGNADYSITVDGKTTIATDKTLTLNYTADVDYAKSSLAINGAADATVKVVSNALAENGNAVALDLGEAFAGTLDWTGDYKVEAVALGSAKALVLNGGTIWTAEDSATIATAVNVYADSTVAAGTDLELSGGFNTQNATLTLGDGAKLALSAGTAMGAIAVADGDKAELSVSAEIISGAKLTLSGTGLTASLDTADANKGTILVSGATLTVAKVQSAGTLVLADGATVKRTVAETETGTGFGVGTIESVDAESTLVFTSNANRDGLALGTAFAGTLELVSSADSGTVDFTLANATSTTGTKFVLGAGTNLLTAGATALTNVEVSGDGTLKFSNGGEVTLAGTNTISTAIATEDASGTAGVTIASGTTTISKAIAKTDFTSALTVSSGATLLLTAAENSLAGKLTVAGTLTANDLAGAEIEATGTITAGALTADSLTLTGATLTVNSVSAATIVATGAADIDVTGTLKATTSAKLAGTIDAGAIDAATLEFTGGTATVAGKISATMLTLSGDAEVGAGTVETTGAISVAGTLETGTLTVGSTVDEVFTGAALTLTSGSITATTISAGTTNVTAGTLKATDSLTLDGDLTIASGAKVSAGTLTMTGTTSTALKITNDGTLAFTTAELTNVSATNLTVATGSTAAITTSTVDGLTVEAGTTAHTASATIKDSTVSNLTTNSGSVIAFAGTNNVLAGTNTLAGELIIDNSAVENAITLAADSSTTLTVDSFALDLSKFDIEAAKSDDGVTYTIFKLADSTATLTGWEKLSQDNENLYKKLDIGTGYELISDLHNVITFNKGDDLGTFTFKITNLTLTWNGGNGVWATEGDTKLWLTEENKATLFYDLDSVVFGTAGATVTVDSAKSVGSMEIDKNTTLKGLGANGVFINVVDTASPNVTIASGATLTLEVAGTGEVLKNASVNGAGTFKVYTDNADTLLWTKAFAGTTLSDVAFAKDGTGTLKIDADEFGATKIDILAGTLEISGDTDISTVKEASVAQAATLALQIFDGGDEVSFEKLSGRGSLKKLGDGNLNLTGTLLLTGGLEIVEGSVTLKSVSAAGSGTTTVDAGASLILDVNTSATMTTTVIGAGTIEKVNNSTLKLAGDNSVTVDGKTTYFEGTVLVSAGTLVLTEDTVVPAAATAEIAADAILQLEFENGGEYAAKTIGAGTLKLAGTKETTILSGNASKFAGKIEIASGRVRVTNGDALGSTDTQVSLAKGAILELHAEADLEKTFGQKFEVAESATIRKTGAGRAILTNAANSILAQRMEVSAGTLTSKGVDALGKVKTVDVAAGATLEIEVSKTAKASARSLMAVSDLPTVTETLDATTVVGDGSFVISGGGVLEITNALEVADVTVTANTTIITQDMTNVGTGTVTVEENSTWYVNEHEFVVSDIEPDLPSEVIVNDTSKIVIGTATFSGTGSTMSISNVSIADDAGTTVISFAVETVDDLSVNRIVGGTITGIENLVIDVEVADGVTIEDGVVKVFSDGTVISKDVIDNAVVTVEGQDGDFQIVDTGKGNWALSTSAIVDTYNLGYSSMIAMSRDVFGQDILAIHNRLETRRFETAEPGNTEFFAQMQASTVDNGNNVSKSGRFDYDTYGAIVGGDSRIAAGTIVGLALGYDHGKADIHGSQGKIEMDNYRLTAFASQLLCDYAYVEGGLSAGTASYDVKRTGSNSKESVNGYNVGAYARVGAVVPLMDKLALLPYVGVSALYSTHEDFSDGLYDVDSGDATSLQGRVGASLRYDFSFASAYKTSLTFDVAYVHEFADNELTTDGKTAKSNFSRDEVIADDDYLTLGVEASMSIGLGASAFIGYSADIGEDTTHHAHVGLRYKF